MDLEKLVVEGLVDVPSQWSVVTLEDCVRPDAPICYGILMPGRDHPGGVPVIKVKDIMNGRIAVSGLLKTDPSIDAAYKRSRLRANDVLVTIRGTTGRLAIVPASLDGANITQDTARLRVRDSVSSTFLYYSLQASSSQRQIALHTVGQAVRGINIADLKSVAIALPSTLSEQRRIADTLSEVDGVLDGLGRLVTKKQNVKRALMQRLLPGDTRLPGFQDEWKLRRLGDHIKFLRNGTNSRAELLPEGGARYLHYGDVHKARDVYLSPDSLPFLPEAKARPLDHLRDGDVVFADASEDLGGVTKSVELKGVRTSPVVAGLHTIAARFDPTVVALGFGGLLQFCPAFSTHVRRLAAGTKVLATNRAHVGSVEMCLPSTQEQTAIALVLGDLDREIDALEARRSKTQNLKQGMMEALLTGRVRLPSDEAEAA